MAYIGGVGLTGGLMQAGAKWFPLVKAADVFVNDNSTLDKALRLTVTQAYSTADGTVQVADGPDGDLRHGCPVFTGDANLYLDEVTDGVTVELRWVLEKEGVRYETAESARAGTLPDTLTLWDVAHENSIVLTYRLRPRSVAPTFAIDDTPTEGSNNLVRSGGVASFVNSSVATNTATFRGTYNLVNHLNLTLASTAVERGTALAAKLQELGKESGHNDYCFIQIPTKDATPLEISCIDRYKCTETKSGDTVTKVWEYEFTLNNSSFTAEQWAAINSGIRSGLVEKLKELPAVDDLNAVLEGKQPKLTIEATVTQESGNPVTSSAIWRAIWGALSELPTGVSSLYEWCKARFTAKLDNMVSVTHSALLAARDAGQLKPGQQYRITDYVATVNNSNAYRSAAHPFDIIVTADDAKTLNEHARAMLHEPVLDFTEDTQYSVGDFCKYDGTVYKCIMTHHGGWNADDFTTESPYFYSCDLTAWDIWYCIDNDTGRFAWADTANGKGVVYRLVDEFRNDVPYDFKSIQFFFKRKNKEAAEWLYTFSGFNTADYGEEMSRSGEFRLNVIEQCDRYSRVLHKNVFLGSGVGNVVRNGCDDNEISASAYVVMDELCTANYVYNSFYVLFHKGCSNNVIYGNYSAYYVTFGHYSQGNKVTPSKVSRYIAFGMRSKYNSVTGSDNVSIGEESEGCRVEEGCSYIRIGGYCGGCHVGLFSFGITIGDGCDYVLASGAAESCSIGSLCRLVVFGPKRLRIFSAGDTYAVGDIVCKDYRVYKCKAAHSGAWSDEDFSIVTHHADYGKTRYRNISVGGGCHDLNLSCTGTTSSSVYYQNIEVKSGATGMIEDANTGQTYLTTYKPANSQEIVL